MGSRIGVPPGAIVGPCAYEQQNNGLQREANTIGEQDDRVHCRYRHVVSATSGVSFVARTISDASKVRQDTVCACPTRSYEWWLAGIVPCKEEEILKLGWPEVEAREAVIALPGEGAINNQFCVRSKKPKPTANKKPPLTT